jgi:hypothetical protein
MQAQAGDGLGSRHVDTDKVAPQNNFLLLIMLHSLTTQLEYMPVSVNNNCKIEELKE